MGIWTQRASVGFGYISAVSWVSSVSCTTDVRVAVAVFLLKTEFSKLERKRQAAFRSQCYPDQLFEFQQLGSILLILALLLVRSCGFFSIIDSFCIIGGGTLGRKGRRNHAFLVSYNLGGHLNFLVTYCPYWFGGQILLLTHCTPWKLKLPEMGSFRVLWMVSGFSVWTSPLSKIPRKIDTFK